MTQAKEGRLLFLWMGDAGLKPMNESTSRRRRQFCARCGQLMFEFFSSPDGHFGLVDELRAGRGRHGSEVVCPSCGARYRLLDRINAMGQPVERK